YSGFNSHPTKSSPRRCAAIPVLPEPANGSKTTPARGSAAGHWQVGRQPMVLVSGRNESSNAGPLRFAGSIFSLPRGPHLWPGFSDFAVSTTRHHGAPHVGQ